MAPRVAAEPAGLEAVAGGGPADDSIRRRRRARTRVALEIVVLVAVAAFSALEVGGFSKSVAAGFSRLAHPDAAGLALAAVAQVVSLLAFAQVPRWLLRRVGVRLPAVDAVALAMAANGMSVVLPAGAVSASVWTAHQYTRRGARAAGATWTVLAAGFASSVTLIAIGIAGAGVSGLAAPSVAAGLGIGYVAGVAGFVRLAHRIGDRVARSGAGGTRPGRVLAHLEALLAGTAGQRAGWSTGAAVLAGAGLNWLADVGCLAAVFVALHLPLPWGGLLLAFAAGQLAGAVVPLPGGFGVVEAGTAGVLVALGVAVGPAVAVVAVYRLLSWVAPLLSAPPAYAYALRRVGPGRDGDGRRRGRRMA